MKVTTKNVVDDRYWKKIILGSIYNKVLNKGMKIRVKRVDVRGDYWLELYSKSGWWIFKRKIVETTYVLNHSHASFLDVFNGTFGLLK